MDVVSNPVPPVSFEIVAFDFMNESTRNAAIVDGLISKGLSAHEVGKIIFYDKSHLDNADIDNGDDGKDIEEE